MQKKQDAESFAKLYEGVYKDMYAYAFYMLRNAQDAEDVVSETVMVAYENIEKLRRAEKFRNWIFSILANQCKKKRKSYINEPEKLVEDIPEEERGVSVEEKQDLIAAFQVLNDEERFIVNSFIFGGYKGAEIAKQLEIKAVTVRSKYKRALEKLRKYLEGGAL